MACRKCDCYKNKYGINCISFSGNENAELYFLGEQAGKEEAKASIKTPSHFIGSAGKIFDKLLEMSGINRKDVAVANSARCFKEKNVAPTKKELDACFIYTQREVRRMKPKLVIAMGSTAMMQALGKSIEDFKFTRGRLVWSDRLKCNVFTTYHPAALIYDNKKQEAIEEDFNKILELKDKSPAIQKHYDFTLISSREEFEKAYPRIIGQPIGFDGEMEELNPYDPNIDFLSIQIGISEKEIYVLDRKAIYECIDLLENIFKECPVVGQGFEFDAKWLNIKLGISINNWFHDTCLAEYLISGMKNNDLDFLTGKYNSDYFGYWEDVKEVGGAHKIKDAGVRNQYAADDVGTMFPIMKKQYKLLVKEGRDWLFDNIWMPCNKVLTKASLRGVEVDLDKLWKLDKKYDRKAQKLLYKAMVLPGVLACEDHFRRKFNPRSPQMISWLLFDYYNLPVLKRNKPTKKNKELGLPGSPSTGQDEMEKYAKEHKNEYCIIMERYRSIQTVRDNFLSGLVPKLVNGTAHTIYSLHATTTGRPNSKDPNLLNVPSKDELEEIKSTYKARDGYVFLAADMSQIEVRVASVIYNDQNLIDKCNEPGRDDFHSVITSQVFNKDYDWIYKRYSNEDHPDHKMVKEWRRQCKSITFGILYQESAWALAYALGVTEEEAIAFIKNYFSGFPDLEKNIEAIKEFVLKNGYCDTYFKFRRWFPDYNSEEQFKVEKVLRQAVNSPIQGTAWNLMQLSLIEIDKRLEELDFDVGIVMQVYDSVIVETPEDKIDIVAPIIKETMENINKPYEGINRVKLKTDVEVGYNLYDLRRV